MARRIALSCLVSAMPACITRAPTDYELDRRAGLMPATDVDKLGVSAAEISLNGGVHKTGVAPLRTVPWVEKVLVHDQEIDGGYWLQGTWAFLEVEPGRWLVGEECDVTGGWRP